MKGAPGLSGLFGMAPGVVGPLTRSQDREGIVLGLVALLWAVLYLGLVCLGG